MSDDTGRIQTEVIDPDVPVRFVRLVVEGDEVAMIPWDEAEAIAEAVEQYDAETE